MKKVLIIGIVLIVLVISIVLLTPKSPKEKEKKTVDKSYQQALNIIESNKDNQKEYTFVKKTSEGIYIFKDKKKNTYEVDINKKVYTVKTTTSAGEKNN